MLFPAVALAQQKDSLNFNQNIIDYSMDTSGNIFLSFEGGTITKFSSSLDSLFSYSPLKVADTKLLEAGTGLVIFAFYDFFQEYLLTDRFLTRPTRSKFPTSIGYIDIATQSLDNNIWMIESANFSLVKYNVQLLRIEIETLLNTVVESDNNSFTFIKEYQNQVFLVDENSGIYVFDNLGNFSNLIQAKTKKVGFYSSKMLYLEDHKLITKDIYTNNKEVRVITEQGVIGVAKHKSNSYYIKHRSIVRVF